MRFGSNGKRNAAAPTQPNHRSAPETRLGRRNTKSRQSRKWTRRSVRWVAQWMHPAGGECSGQICDVSAKGLFLRPMEGETSPPPIGAQITISYSSPNRRDGLVTVQGTIRWYGASYSHQCSGFGVELDSKIATPTGDIVPLALH